MAPMRSAEELYVYCTENNLGDGMTITWSVKSFQIIVDMLKPSETVHAAFIGKLDGHSYAVVITDERIIAANKGLVGKSVKSVSLHNINDTTMKQKLLTYYVEIDTSKERLAFFLNSKHSAENIYHSIHQAISMKRTPAAAPAPAASAADEILKLKNLLDAGAITQEEFQAMKQKFI